MKANELYQALVIAVDKLPKEAIEVAPKTITRKGYDTTGYGYMFLVNVMNEVIGIGDWGQEYEIVKEIEGTWGSGKKYWEITVNVKVWLMVGDKRAEHICAGGHKAEMYADALKGAITNGFKKTVAFFGIGKRAYEGTIDEDYRPIPEEPAKKTTKPKADDYTKSKATESPKKGSVSQSQIARIHILQKEKGLDDEKYRLLLGNYGVESSKDLDADDALQLIVDLENTGSGKPEGSITKSQATMITHIIETKKIAKSAMDSMLKAIGVSTIGELTRVQARLMLKEIK